MTPLCCLWDVQSGTHLRTMEGHTGNIYSVVFSPNGKTLASASLDETVRLWDVRTGTFILTLAGHTSVVTDVVFSSDGRTIASTSGGNVLLWELTTTSVK